MQQHTLNLGKPSPNLDLQDETIRVLPFLAISDLAQSLKGYGERTPLMSPNEVTREIIGAAIDVHRELGPGHNEILHEDALEVSLKARGLRFRRQPALPVVYKGVKLDCGFRPDFVVEDCVVAECKSVETLHSVFAAQVRTYQRVGGWRLGLLLNFNVHLMKEGISRFTIDPIEFRTDVASACETGTAPGELEADPVTEIIGAAIEVHRHLGMGLLNSVYTACLLHELNLRGLKFSEKHSMPVSIQGTLLAHPATLGLIVEKVVSVIILSVPKILPVHEAQARSQMRLGNLQTAILLNFHENRLIDGLRRLNNPQSEPSSQLPSL